MDNRGFGLLRGIASVAAGLLTAAVFFAANAALLVVATVGVPRGAESRRVTSDTFGDLAGYLAVGIAAAVVGGWVTARITGARTTWPLLVLGLALGVSAYVEFTNPTSQWPYWWAVMLTALAPAAAWVGGRGLRFVARDRAH